MPLRDTFKTTKLAPPFIPHIVKRKFEFQTLHIFLSPQTPSSALPQEAVNKWLLNLECPSFQSGRFNIFSLSECLLIFQCY